MSIWPPDLSKGSGPLYKRLSNHVVEAVRTGRLVQGSKLPSHRDLASQLGIAVGSVAKAYEQLIEMGVVRSTVGHGTVVIGERDNNWIGLRSNATSVDMRLVMPPPLVDASLLAELGRKTHQEIGSQWELLDLGAYPPETGLERHRKIMASWCTELGVPATEKTITITSGAQEALHAIILALARKGSPIMTEALTMVALKNLCGVLGTPIIGVDTDGDGVTPHALEACAARSGARLVILFADLQLPTGLRMSQERRLAIAEIARKRDLLVVEYDAYAGWARRTFPSFSELLPERALHLHSLSDVTMPGLGCGVLHSPIELGNQITRVRHATVLATSSLVCEVATRWVSSGAARRTLEAHRNEIIARQNIAAEFFPVELEAAVPGCPFIWISAGTWRAGDLVAEASASGVEVLAGERFQVSDAQPPNAIRMAISSPPDQGILRRGLTTIRHLLDR